VPGLPAYPSTWLGLLRNLRYDARGGGEESLNSEEAEALRRVAVTEGIQRLRVAAVIVREGRLLLVRRAACDSLPGMFELPSGGVEKGERLLAALRREVREETSLRVLSVTCFVGAFDYVSHGRAARQFTFRVQVGAGEPRLDPNEHDCLAWVIPADLDHAGVSSQLRGVLRGIA
jgi:8-oxo-dGTP diphosphatase